MAKKVATTSERSLSKGRGGGREKERRECLDLS
jgi:hypothetical protein